MTRDPAWTAPGTERAAGWDDALRLAAGADEVMVAGGAEIYALALPHAGRIHLTEVDAAPEGMPASPRSRRISARSRRNSIRPAPRTSTPSAS